MTKVVHLYASQRVSRRAKDGEPGKPGISPAAYQVSFKLQNHYVYIYVTKTQGETTTTHLIGKWNDTLTCNVYINGVYTNYKDSDVMRDSYIDLWAFPSAKTIEIVLKRKSDGQQLAIGNYAIVSEFEIQVNPEVVVFDTDKDGNLTTPSKTATITCLRNGMNVTQSCVFSFDNCAHLNCSPSINSNTVIIKKITTVTVDDINIPNQNGYAQVQITDEHGEKRYAFVKFQVNIAMFVGDVYHDTKNLVSKYDEISGKVDGISGKVDDLPTRNDLTKFESSILQSARSISMEVVEKSILRRNLLRGSSFGRHDETYLSPNVIIEKNSGIDGVNCIHSSDKYSGTGDGNYIGAFWDSTQGNGVVTNIPIVKGKKYVISCWIKSDNLNLQFCIECLYMKSINQQSRDDAKNSKSEAFKVTEKNKWQKISYVLDTDNADATEYLAVNFWSNNKNVPKVTDANGKTYYPTCHAYICKPMMEEGDTYSGWTLSEEDYDYVGGNLIDNTRLLQKSDNSSAAGALTVAGGEITANGYESEYSVAHGDTTSFSSSSYLELLKWNVIGCVASNQDYVFSFLAKGTGTVSTYLYKDGSPRFFVEGSDGKKDATSTDGYVSFKLTNEWKRYWVHYYLHTTTEHPLPETLLVRCYADNDVYICKPKLEIGAYMTEYTERKTDLVDKASLKKAGIEITSEQVTLYGNKVQVKTPKENPSEGYDEAAMFQNGKLNANLIDAKNIVTQGLMAGDIDAEKATIKNLSIIGSSRNPFTRVSESTDVDFNDNIAVITKNYLWEKNEYSLPWDNGQNGRRITIMNLKWNNEIASTGAEITAPDGMYFFENGLKKKTLSFSRECIELLGIGDNTNFFGWVVTNRTDLASLWCRGATAKVLAFGSVVAKVVNNTLNLTVKQVTFDNQEIKVTQVLGGYKMTFPSNWDTAINYVPILTPYKFIGHVYIKEVGEHYMIIGYSGKSTENRDWDDASFRFTIQTSNTLTVYNA